MNPRNKIMLRKVDGNGVEYTGTMSGCDIFAVGKSTQKTHRETDQHKTNERMKLVNSLYRLDVNHHTSNPGRIPVRQQVY